MKLRFKRCVLVAINGEKNRHRNIKSKISSKEFLNIISTIQIALIEQKQASIIKNVIDYIENIRYPKKDIRISSIYKFLKEVELKEECHKPLETRAKTLGGFLSKNFCVSYENKYPFTNVQNNLHKAFHYISEKKKHYNISYEVKINLGRFLDIISRIQISLAHSSENSAVGYCPFCWRQPSPGINSHYCKEHHPFSYKDPVSGRIIYETEDYDKAKVILKRAVKYFKISPLPLLSNKDTNQYFKNRVWGELKLLCEDKYQESEEASMAWERILDIETNNRRDILSLHKKGVSSPPEALWEINDWHVLARLISKHINGQPLLKNKVRATASKKNESRVTWLRRLAKSFGEETELMFDVEPGEILGLVDRYQHYLLLLDKTKPKHSTQPKLSRNAKCIALINNGKSFSEAARILKISRQRAHQIYHSN